MWPNWSNIIIIVKFRFSSFFIWWQPFHYFSWFILRDKAVMRSSARNSRTPWISLFQFISFDIASNFFIANVEKIIPTMFWVAPWSIWLGFKIWLFSVLEFLCHLWRHEAWHKHCTCIYWQSYTVHQEKVTCNFPNFIYISVKEQLANTKIVFIYATMKLTMGLKLNSIFCSKSLKVTLWWNWRNHEAACGKSKPSSNWKQPNLEPKSNASRSNPKHCWNNFFYISDEEVTSNIKAYKLKQRYSRCSTVSGTRSHHCFIPQYKSTKVMKRLSSDEKGAKAKLYNDDNITSIRSHEQLHQNLQPGKYVACLYHKV